VCCLIVFEQDLSIGQGGIVPGFSINDEQITAWHTSTDTALHDTAKQSKDHDQQWAALFSSDHKKPL